MANRHVKKEQLAHPWPYGHIERCIEQLEEDDQPWAVARYHGKARFVAGECTYFYELIIFQTFDAESPISCMMMDRNTYRDLIAQYGLTKRYSIPDGELFSRSDWLRDLVKKYLRERDALSVEYEVAHTTRLRLGRLLSHGERPNNNGITNASRNGWIAKEQSLKKKLSDFQGAFAKKHGIIIYNF